MRPFLVALAFACAAAVMWPLVGWLSLAAGILAAAVVYLLLLFASVHFPDGPTIF